MITFPVIVVGLVVLYLLNSLKVLREYERGVIFRLGRVLPAAKGPGLIFVFAPIDRIVRVSLRLVTMDIPPQDVITRDNVSVKVNAVVYFRVMEPLKAIIEVEDYLYATSQLAQTTLRSVLGEVELDDLLSEREKLNAQLQDIIDKHTDPWGIKVQLVEMKHVDLPEEMQRAIARQAEAERERRAKVIHADGRVPGRRQAGRGRQHHCGEPAGPAAALSPDADRDRRGEELHDHLPDADRAAPVLRSRSAEISERVMKNREFRELQVSSTQLAIIFFGILIIGVVIFLLGVSVGKKHAQAASKSAASLAQKAPEQVKDRLIVPEAKAGAPQTAEALQAGARREDDRAGRQGGGRRRPRSKPTRPRRKKSGPSPEQGGGGGFASRRRGGDRQVRARGRGRRSRQERILLRSGGSAGGESGGRHAGAEVQIAGIFGRCPRPAAE